MLKFKRHNIQKNHANYSANEPLAIIAGQGALPHLILRNRANLPNYIIAIKDQTPQDIVNGVAHEWFGFGEIGKMLQFLQKNNITQITMAGRLVRPSLSAIKPDEKGVELLKTLGGSLLRGDNGLLSNIIAFLEKHNVSVVGAHDICKDLLAENGCMTATQPMEENEKDFLVAKELLQAISPFDVGQAVVLQAGVVLGIEGPEGTAALIERVALLRNDSEIKPILVKLPKYKQELRADMPAIGIDTVQAMHQAGFAGAYLAANKTLMLDKIQIVNQANQLNLFISGVGI